MNEPTPDRVTYFGSHKTLHIVLAVISVGLWLLVLLALYLWRKNRRGWAIAVASVTALLVLVIGIGSGTSPETNDAIAEQETTQTVAEPTEDETTEPTLAESEETIDPTMDERTRQYIAQVQTCQVTVGLTLLQIQRGETDSFMIADSANTAADTCETIKTNLATTDTNHFDDEALLAWSGVSEMKSGMNALLAYIDDPRPTKLIEARDKIQKGDAQAAEGIRQINRRRTVYGLEKIAT